MTRLAVRPQEVNALSLQCLTRGGSTITRKIPWEPTDKPLLGPPPRSVSLGRERRNDANESQSLFYSPYRGSSVWPLSLTVRFRASAPACASGQSLCRKLGRRSVSTKTGAERSLTFRKGANGLEEVRGSYTRPLVEPVRFGAGPYPFGEPNATMEWKQQGDGRFERTMMATARRWKLARLPFPRR